MKTISLRFKKRLDEVFIIEPNDLGVNFLTDIYKKTTHYFKNLPFLIIVPLSFVAVIAAYLLFGYLIIKLVSLLQYGF